MSEGPASADPASADPASDAPRCAARRLVRDVERRAAARHLRTADHLTGVYLHGSAVLGGWHEVRSDVDLLVVVPAAIESLDLWRAALLESVETCPGAGMECSIVTDAAVRDPGAPWPFLLHVTSTGGAVRWVRGADADGDPDLLMHYAVTREHGWAAAGPAPGGLFGAVPRAAVLQYLLGELSWGLEHADEAYAVLNALRALEYVEDGRLVSKVDAGRRAQHRADLPGEVVRRALAAQEGRRAHRPAGADAAGVVDQVSVALGEALIACTPD